MKRIARKLKQIRKSSSDFRAYQKGETLNVYIAGIQGVGKAIWLMQCYMN